MRAPMVSDCKTRIGAAFGAAAPHYDGDAGIHRLVAARLIAFAADHAPRDPKAILEIGCGTGILTRLIDQQWPQAALTATDIAPDMVAETSRACSRAQLLVMDGEAPDLGEERFDLILSSLSFQWFEHLPAALARLHRLLRPGGSLCFATMGADSFRDWRDAHQREGLHCGLRDYPSLADLRGMMDPLGPTAFAQDMVPLAVSGGLALTRHFHAIGARVPRADYHRLTPPSLRRVIARFDGDGGASAYHIIYGRIGHD